MPSKTQTFFKIYFPMTADILHPGHIKCIRWLQERCDELIIGVLTDKALGKYKNPVMPLKDRMYMLENLAWNGIPITVIQQDSINPSANIKRNKVQAIASGDGWEKAELEAIKKYNLKVINIRLKGEKKGKKLYASSKIKQLCKEF